MFQVHTERFGFDDRFVRVYRRVRVQPPWVWGTALLIGGVIFIIPLVLLTIGAVLTIALIYILLSLVHRITSGIARLLTPGDQEGRRNVRVIRPDESR
jgi:hypothetical protein